MNEVCKYPRCSCRATGVYCSQYKPKAPTKRKAIPKRSSKGWEKLKVKQNLVQTDMIFYLDQVWSVRPHICAVTGLTLGEPKIYMFHHCLAKRNYPQYRHKPWNILLVSWEAHDKIERNLSLEPIIENLTRLMKLADSKGLLERLNDNITDPLTLLPYLVEWEKSLSAE